MSESHTAIEERVTLLRTDWHDRYLSQGPNVRHELAIGDIIIQADLEVGETNDDDPKGMWWRGYLEGSVPSPSRSLGGRLRTVDLFCGSGGLANGVHQLCTELGVVPVSEFIADEDEGATLVYAANHFSRNRSTRPVQMLTDYRIQYSDRAAKFAYHPELVGDAGTAGLENVHLVLAGPPCQGHSNLNNHTRRSDARNGLYLSVPAFAVAVGAPICIIENVPAILNDDGDVVSLAKQLLEDSGYFVTSAVISAADLGWPQARKRHFLVARRDTPPIPLEDVADLLGDEARSFWWAVGDLEDELGTDLLGQVSQLSPANKARIDWLFDNDEYDLALEERPRSHQDGTTYTAVYGRLRKEEPAPTITTGFMSPGRGRFTHPTQRRALSAREAARLQGFPDDYVFVPDPDRPPSRVQLTKWIGDAVPMPLGYAAALSAVGNGLPG